MKIADFLNLIARNSDQAETGMSHYFYTKLMLYFVEFLQEVLRIQITLLILTSGKDNTLFHHEGNTTEFTSDHFLVLVRKGGQDTCSSHYGPLLLDYKLENVWQSCGLLLYKDLPKFVIALLEKHQTLLCKKSYITSVIAMILFQHTSSCFLLIDCRRIFLYGAWL